MIEERQDFQDKQAIQAPLEIQGPREIQGSQALREPQEKWDQRASPVALGRAAHQAKEENPEPRATLVLGVIQGSQGNRASLAMMDVQGNRVNRDRMANQGNQAPLEFQVRVLSKSDYGMYFTGGISIYFYIIFGMTLKLGHVYIKCIENKCILCIVTTFPIKLKD